MNIVFLKTIRQIVCLVLAVTLGLGQTVVSYAAIGEILRPLARAERNPVPRPGGRLLLAPDNPESTGAGAATLSEEQPDQAAIEREKFAQISPSRRSQSVKDWLVRETERLGDNVFEGMPGVAGLFKAVKGGDAQILFAVAGDPAYLTLLDSKAELEKKYTGDDMTAAGMIRAALFGSPETSELPLPMSREEYRELIFVHKKPFAEVRKAFLAREKPLWTAVGMWGVVYKRELKSLVAILKASGIFLANTPSCLIVVNADRKDDLVVGIYLTLFHEVCHVKLPDQRSASDDDCLAAEVVSKVVRCTLLNDSLLSAEAASAYLALDDIAQWKTMRSELLNGRDANTQLRDILVDLREQISQREPLFDLLVDPRHSNLIKFAASGCRADPREHVRMLLIKHIDAFMRAAPKLGTPLFPDAVPVDLGVRSTANMARALNGAAAKDLTQELFEVLAHKREEQFLDDSTLAVLVRIQEDAFTRGNFTPDQERLVRGKIAEYKRKRGEAQQAKERELAIANSDEMLAAIDDYFARRGEGRGDLTVEERTLSDMGQRAGESGARILTDKQIAYTQILLAKCRAAADHGRNPGVTADESAAVAERIDQYFRRLDASGDQRRAPDELILKEMADRLKESPGTGAQPRRLSSAQANFATKILNALETADFRELYFLIKGLIDRSTEEGIDLGRFMSFEVAKDLRENLDDARAPVCGFASFGKVYRFRDAAQQIRSLRDSWRAGDYRLNNLPVAARVLVHSACEGHMTSTCPDRNMWQHFRLLAVDPETNRVRAGAESEFRQSVERQGGANIRAMLAGNGMREAIDALNLLLGTQPYPGPAEQVRFIVDSSLLVRTRQEILARIIRMSSPERIIPELLDLLWSPGMSAQLRSDILEFSIGAAEQAPEDNSRQELLARLGLEVPQLLGVFGDPDQTTQLRLEMLAYDLRILRLADGGVIRPEYVERIVGVAEAAARLVISNDKKGSVAAAVDAFQAVGPMVAGNERAAQMARWVLDSLGRRSSGSSKEQKRDQLQIAAIELLDRVGGSVPAVFDAVGSVIDAERRPKVVEAACAELAKLSASMDPSYYPLVAQKVQAIADIDATATRRFHEDVRERLRGLACRMIFNLRRAGAPALEADLVRSLGFQEDCDYGSMPVLGTNNGVEDAISENAVVAQEAAQAI